MKLKVLKALWGMEHWPLERQFAMIAEAGFAGVESPLPDEKDEERFRRLLEEYKFDYIAMVFTGGPDHAASFASQVERAVTFNPILINSHSAKDDMPYAAQLEFFRFAVEIERRIGITIGHETHRGRAMFTPWATEQLLKDVPGLHLTADYSHFCNVCESHLEDQGERLALTNAQTRHVHARVGHPEGPQVNHPAAPENAYSLTAHAAWWQDMARKRRDAGAEVFTVVPEFGPPGYMPTLPFTQQPVSDLWEVCLWMKGYIERNWAEWLS